MKEVFDTFHRQLENANVQLEFQAAKKRHLEEESRCHELMRKEIRKEHEATVSRLADVESEADAVVQSCTNSFKENARLNETIKSIDVRCAKVATIVSRAEAKSSSMNAALAKNANKAEIAASSCSHIVIANDAIDLVRSEMQRAICALTQLTAAVPSKELIDDIRERAKRLEQREAALAARKVILREMGAGIDEKLSFIIKEREILDTLKETSASLSAQMASCVNEEHVESETIEVLEKRFAKINELKASLSKKKALDSEVALLEARLKERQEEAEHKQGELVRRLEAINLSRAKLQDAKAQREKEIEKMVKEFEEAKEQSTQLAREISKRMECIDLRFERKVHEQQLEAMQNALLKECERKADAKRQLEVASRTLKERKNQRCAIDRLPDKQIVQYGGMPLRCGNKGDGDAKLSKGLTTYFSAFPPEYEFIAEANKPTNVPVVGVADTLEGIPSGQTVVIPDRPLALSLKKIQKRVKNS